MADTEPINTSIRSLCQEPSEVFNINSKKKSTKESFKMKGRTKRSVPTSNIYIRRT